MPDSQSNHAISAEMSDIIETASPAKLQETLQWLLINLNLNNIRYHDNIEAVQAAINALCILSPIEAVKIASERLGVEHDLRRSQSRKRTPVSRPNEEKAFSGPKTVDDESDFWDFMIKKAMEE